MVGDVAHFMRHGSVLTRERQVDSDPRAAKAHSLRHSRE